MSTSARVVAAAAAACLVTALASACVMRTSSPGHGPVQVRSLSSSDLLAVPPHAATSVPYRLVILGDSVGTGAGCGCPPFGSRVAQLLAGATAAPVEVANLARDGQTSGDLDDELASDVKTADEIRAAEAVTVVIGANDFDADEAGRGCSGAGTACFDEALAQLPTRLDAALGRIRALAGPRLRLLVLGYWNVFLDGAVGAQQGATYQHTSDALTRRVNAVLADRAARAGASFVDAYAAFHRGDTSDDTALLAPDGDHPSAAGHQRIAELLEPLLAVAAG